MACKDCEERRKRLRDAIMHGKMAEALDITVEGLRVMIGIDAGADHRKEAAETLAVGGVIATDPKPIPVIGEGGIEAVLPKRKTPTKDK